jgi:hypothetical protein
VSPRYSEDDMTILLIEKEILDTEKDSPCETGKKIRTGILMKRRPQSYDALARIQLNFCEGYV